MLYCTALHCTVPYCTGAGVHPEQKPYYNKPDYERNYGTATGNRESLRHAVLAHIRAPPEGFGHVSWSHFYYKRDTLIKVRLQNNNNFLPLYLCLTL